MSKSATDEYVGRTRQRYRAMNTKLAKGRGLDEFCETSGYERKHAIKLLNGRAANRQNRADRKAKYDEDVKEVLVEVWKMNESSPRTALRTGCSLKGCAQYL